MRFQENNRNKNTVLPWKKKSHFTTNMSFCSIERARAAMTNVGERVFKVLMLPHQAIKNE